MRVIHYSIEGGRRKAIVFTEEDVDALDFIDTEEGWKVDFDEIVIFSSFSSEFLPSADDMYIRVDPTSRG